MVPAKGGKSFNPLGAEEKFWLSASNIERGGSGGLGGGGGGSSCGVRPFQYITGCVVWSCRGLRMWRALKLISSGLACRGTLMRDPPPTLHLETGARRSADTADPRREAINANGQLW